jgi:hypothetical protein
MADLKEHLSAPNFALNGEKLSKCWKQLLVSRKCKAQRFLTSFPSSKGV